MALRTAAVPGFLMPTFCTKGRGRGWLHSFDPRGDTLQPGDQMRQEPYGVVDRCGDPGRERHPFRCRRLTAEDNHLDLWCTDPPQPGEYGVRRQRVRIRPRLGVDVDGVGVWLDDAQRPWHAAAR